jgi:hypothetical protein
MSWITIVWSMNAAACLTLAGIYLLVWCKQREDWVPLVFSVTAVAGAALTAFELALLRAQTTAQYAALLRWVQLPVWVLVVSLGGFRAALPPCRATMARMECLWRADIDADLEFCFCA